jgi:hypothetical protein
MPTSLRAFSDRLAKVQLKLEQLSTRKNETKLLIVPDKLDDFCSSIVMRSGGKMLPFNLYIYQVLLARIIAAHPTTVVVKTRQLGTTQSVIALLLHEAAKNPAFAASCFMRNEDDATAINSRIRWLAEQARLDREKEESKLIRLINGAEIRTHNQSKEGNRSADSLMYLFFDEAAFQTNIATIYSASVGSTILTGEDAKVIIVSTPSAKSGWYWDKLNENNGDRDIEDICSRVANCELYSDNLPGFYWFTDENGNAKVFIHWRCHPVYSQNDNFVEDMAKKLNMDLVDAKREFNLEFSDAAIEVFSAESIADAEIRDRSPDPSVKSCSIGLYFNGTHTAAVCLVDGIVVKCVSERNRSANTAIALVNAATRGYHPAAIVLKRADGGEKIASRLIESNRSSRVIDIAESDIPNAIMSLGLLLEERKIKIPPYLDQLRDPPLAKQLRDFRRQDKKLGALEKGKRDDCAFALALAVMASEYIPKRLPVGST